MDRTLRLCDTMVHELSQHQHWLDRWHRKTRAWMRVGLMQSRMFHLMARTR